MARVHNFNAGPAVLPVPVLEQVQAELLELPGAGMSVMEVSHRSKAFEEIIARAEADLRELLGIPEGYHVLFLQGGASLQFSMVPMNLLAEGQSADYIITGSWAKKAVQEAAKAGSASVAADMKEQGYRRVPQTGELKLDPSSRYVHLTSNETIQGVQWRQIPNTGGVPLVADASSDILSGPLEVERYGVIYGGAQKNMGPSGVTLVIIRDDLVGHAPANCPTMLDYRTHVKDKSLYNTPNTFGIYVVGLVCGWLKGLGGLQGIARLNEEKASLLYGVIDEDEFYRGHAEKDSRSRMNVTFRLPDEELEAQFAKEATAAGLVGLKGHRSVGGIRASIYNACPLEAVRALAQFMGDFRRSHG